MAPQIHVPLSADVLGTIGTVVGVYKVWQNYRRKNTDGLSGLMFILWAACAVPFGAYSIIQNFNIPTQIQPQCLALLTLVCWAQTQVYHEKRPTWLVTAVALATAATFAGAELALIYGLRGPYRRGVSWPITLVGIVAAVLFGVGLLPPYFELAKRRGRVIGFSWFFFAIDWAGGFFSLMGLATQESFDVIGAANYLTCIGLESGIILSQLIWLYRFRHQRAAAKRLDVSFDAYMDLHLDTHATVPPLTEVAIVSPPTMQSVDISVGDEKRSSQQTATGDNVDANANIV